MATNNFNLKVQAVLDKVKSIANIKADIKAIEPKLPKMKIQGTLDSTSTRKELNSKLKSVKPKVKIDADTTQAEKKIKKIGKQKTNTTITPTVDNTQVVSGLKKAQKETKTLWERFVSGAIGANLVRMSVQKVTQAIHEAVKAVKELDTIKTNIQMVSGTTNSEVNSMMQSYNAMAKELSSTTKEVGEAANEFLRMGESVANTNELIKNATILSKVGMIDSADAASYLISSMKGYQVSAENSIDIVSKLTAVDLEAAVSAGGLAEAISRCSNIANNSGTSMNRLIGYAASIGEVTQESMSVVGNSLKSMYSRMNNIKIGRYLDEETGESLSDTEAVLNKLGIQLRDTEDTYRNFDDVLDDVGKNWKNFTQIEQNAISVAIAGTMQRERFTALMNNYSSALEYSEVAANSAGSALERYGVYQDSIEAKTNELTAAIESLSTNIVSEELYSGIIQATTGLVEFLDKTNLLKTSLAGLVAMGVSKAIVSMRSGFITATKSAKQLSTVMMMLEGERSADNLRDIGEKCVGLSEQQLRLIMSTKGLEAADRKLILEGMGVVETEREQTLATLGFAAAEDKATASTFSLSGVFKALKTAIVSNPVALLATALMAAAATIKGIIAVTKAFEQAQKKESDAAAELYEKSKQKIQSNKEEIKSLDELIRKYEELKSKSVMDSDTREEIKGIQYDIVDLVGSEAKTLDLVNGKLDEQLSKLKSISEEKSRQNVEDARDAYDNAKYLSDVMVGGADDYGNDVSVKWSDTEAAQIHKVEGFEKFTYQDFIKLLHDNGFGDIFRENNDGNLFNMRFVVDTKDIEGLEAKVARLEELKDFLASNGLRSTGLYQGVNDAIGKYNEQNNNELESANNLVDAVVDNLSVSNEKLKEITVDSVESFEEYRQKMMDEAKSDGDISKMLADGILSNENLEISVNNYMATAEQFSEWYEQWKTGIEGAVSIENPTLSISDTVTKLDELKEKFDTIDKTYSKLFDSESEIGFEDLSSINEAFADLDGIDDFIQRLQEAGQDTEAVTEVMQDLIAAYLDYSGILDNVTEENSALIEQFLTEMGIENAHEIVLAQLSAQTEILALQKQFLTEKGYELVDATLEEIVQFLKEANASDEAKMALSQLALQKIAVNNTTIDTAADINNVIALANAAGASALALARLEQAKKMIASTGDGSAGWLKQYEAAQKTISDIENGTFDFGFTALDPNRFKVTSSPKYMPKYSGGSNTQKTISDEAEKAAEAAEKAAKETEDVYEELFDFFERRVKVLDDALSLLKTNLDNVTGSFAKNQLVDAELGITEEKFKNYSDALNMYTQKANEALSRLPSDIAEKIKDGAVDLTTFIGDGNEEVVEAIKDYEQWADKVADCKQELAELRTAIRQLELEKFNNIMEDFTNQFDLREDGKDLISKQIDLLKEAGQLIGESFFTTQIDQSQKQLELLENEKKQLVDQMSASISSGRVN